MVPLTFKPNNMLQSESNYQSIQASAIINKNNDVG